MIGQRCSLSLPIVFYIFSILQQCSRLQCLTIDNRIVVTANGNISWTKHVPSQNALPTCIPAHSGASCVKVCNIKYSTFFLDCYTRISIGSKLSDVSIVSRIVVASLTECEHQCSKNGNTCNAFTFG